MNVIDALVVTLGLDPSGYEKGRKDVDASLKKLRETSDKQTKLIAEHGKKAAGAFSALKIEILGALAAFGMGAGFKAFIESSINGQAQLGRLSTALGVSTHHLQAWKLMAREMGGSGDEAVATFQKVAAGMAAARRGDVSFLATANKYGAGLTLGDNVETTMSKLNRMAFAIRQKYGAQQAMGVLNELGISDLNQQLRLTEDPVKFATDFAHAMSLTGAATKASTEQAAKLQKQLADLHERFRQVGERAFVKLEPVLEKLGTQLADWLDSVDWDEVIKKAGEFFDKLGKIVDALGGVKGILIEIAAIKVFGWIANVGMWVLKLRSLTTALGAARAAAIAGGAAGAAGGAAGGAAEAVGGAGLAAGVARTVAGWALPIWALFHSESTGGKRRADGTYEDELSNAQLAATAKAARAMEAKHREQALSYFISKGWTPQQAAGIVANLTAESGLRTNASGDNGQAYGIAQWHKDRQQAFEKFAGHSIKGSSLQEQLAFVDHELRTSEKRAGDRLKQASDAYSAGSLVSMLYERPAAAQAEAEKRARMAQQLSNAYVGARPDVARAKSSTTTNTVSIGTMNVNAPKATNADGIAKGARKAFRDNPLIAGSVTALA